MRRRPAARERRPAGRSGGRPPDTHVGVDHLAGEAGGRGQQLYHRAAGHGHPTAHVEHGGNLLLGGRPHHRIGDVGGGQEITGVTEPADGHPGRVHPLGMPEGTVGRPDQRVGRCARPDGVEDPEHAGPDGLVLHSGGDQVGGQELRRGEITHRSGGGGLGDRRPRRLVTVLRRRSQVDETAGTDTGQHLDQRHREREVDPLAPAGGVRGGTHGVDDDRRSDVAENCREVGRGRPGGVDRPPPTGAVRRGPRPGSAHRHQMRRQTSPFDARPDPVPQEAVGPEQEVATRRVGSGAGSGRRHHRLRRYGGRVDVNTPDFSRANPGRRPPIRPELPPQA